MNSESATVVIAPDSFKGSATAAEVAVALADGWLAIRAHDRVIVAPMADGGEGTLQAFQRAMPNARRYEITVTGPDGRPVESEWLMLPDRTALIELAACSGIGLMDVLDPMNASTIGFGEAIKAALSAGATRLLLALGGSASTDGGAGALSSLGARFVDGEGAPIALGGAGLASLRSADLSGLPALPPRGVQILGDVVSPLLGPNGAARVFAQQKGANAEQVAELEVGLLRLRRALGVADVAGAGAAGGTAYGLLAWGATLTSGASAVGAAIDLPGLVAEAAIVITGEGRFDSQSEAGKVTSYVSRVGHAAGADLLLAAGDICADTRGFRVAVALKEVAGSIEAAKSDPRRWARVAGMKLARVHSSVS